MIVAYADPPYVGKSAKFYGGAEVNHRLLIAHLVDEFPDGWALSCSSPSLRAIWPLCPDGVRVGAWVKPFAVWKPGVNPVYAWEPVIFRGGRQPRAPEELKVQDWVQANPIMGARITGEKPAAFCCWLFHLLGLEAGDQLVDLFPGSGAVAEAWEAYRRQVRLFA